MSSGSAGVTIREDQVDQFLVEASRLQAHLSSRSFVNYRNLKELAVIVAQNEASREDAKRLLKFQQYPALSTDEGIAWLLENAAQLSS